MPSVFVVAPARVLREALISWLSGVQDYTVIGSAASGAEMAADPLAATADLLLVDAQAAADVAAAATDVPVVAVALSEDREALGVALAGNGYGGVCARASLEDLAVTLAATARGVALWTPGASAMLTGRQAAARAANNGSGSAPAPAPAIPAGTGVRLEADTLTSREQEILALVDAGLTNKAIAARLGLSTATVKTHVHNVLEKLGANRRGEAAALVRNGPTTTVGA